MYVATYFRFLASKELQLEYVWNCWNALSLSLLFQISLLYKLPCLGLLEHIPHRSPLYIDSCQFAISHISMHLASQSCLSPSARLRNTYLDNVDNAHTSIIMHDRLALRCGLWRSFDTSPEETPSQRKLIWFPGIDTRSEVLAKTSLKFEIDVYKMLQVVWTMLGIGS